MEDGMGERAGEAAVRDPLEDWRQGDYTLEVVDFPTLVLSADGELNQAFHEVVGVTVVTQTCDIVNTGGERLACPQGVGRSARAGADGL